MTYPRCGIYASLRNKDQVLAPNGVLDRERIGKLARWSDVVLDLGPLIEQPEIVAALREANPAIRIWAYVVMGWWPVDQWHPIFFQRFSEIVHRTNGRVFKTDGSEWGVNFTDSTTVNALAALIAEYLPGFDALFLDVYCARVSNVAASGLDYKKAGFATEDGFAGAWATGHAAMVPLIRDKAGRPDLIVSGNCGPGSHADVNGWMRENWPYLNGGTWASNMLEFIEPNGTRSPGLLNETYREPRASWLVTNPAYGGPAAPENRRRERYGLASACLGGAFHSFMRGEWDSQWCIDRLDFYSPAYRHPQRGMHWLGEPIETAYGHDDGLWARRFQFGISIVNPTDKPISWRGPVLYRPIGGTAQDPTHVVGAAKKAFSVPARDALIAEAV